jgi:hypothetical protein
MHGIENKLVAGANGAEDTASAPHERRQQP